MPTGAQLIVELLEREGVEVAFGLPGVHNLPLWEALRESPIRLVGVRHEQAAGYAADGYARATGRLGVALVTTGPGAANTLGAVGEAWASRSPILVIATDIPAALRRPDTYRGVLHETTDQAAMFAPVTKATFAATGAEDLPALAAEAVRTPTVAPTRPAYLQVPTDVLSADVGSAPEFSPAPPPAADDGAAAELVAGAERPLIWAGSGAVGAGEPLAALASWIAAPVVTTYGAAGVLPPSHPSVVGMPPHVEPVGRLWDEADVVISVGSDLDGVQTQNFAMPQPPKLVAVNVDPVDATKNYRADAVLGGLAAERLSELVSAVPERDGGDGLQGRRREVRAAACASLDSRALRFLDSIRFAVPDDGIVIADMCIPGYWLAGFHTPAAPRKLQIPLGWGTLGYAFPAALGASLAGAGPVIAVAGDGGFLYAPGELATVAQEQLPVTLVIVDDGGYGMLRYDQDVTGADRYGVDLLTPDFAALVRSFGLRAQEVDGLEDDFGEALARHVQDPEPSVLIAHTPEPLVPPPNTSPNWYRRRK
jgi:acetolactate synthase-1/2/3 large subunit